MSVLNDDRIARLHKEHVDGTSLREIARRLVAEGLYSTEDSGRTALARKFRRRGWRIVTDGDQMKRQRNGVDVVRFPTHLIAPYVTKWAAESDGGFYGLARQTRVAERVLYRIARGESRYVTLAVVDEVFVAMNAQHLLHTDPELAAYYVSADPVAA